MKKKINDYPYVLRIIFTPLIKSEILTNALKLQGVKEGSGKIITDRKFTHNFFEIDTTKQTDLRITTILKSDLVEYFTIIMGQDTEIEVVKQVFILLKSLQEFSVEVVDEELETMLYSEKKYVDEFIDRYSKISLSYDDFYTNTDTASEFNVPKRDVLLKKRHIPHK